MSLYQFTFASKKYLDAILTGTLKQANTVVTYATRIQEALGSNLGLNIGNSEEVFVVMPSPSEHHSEPGHPHRKALAAMQTTQYGRCDKTAPEEL
jgi:hypothetical protein